MKASLEIYPKSAPSYPIYLSDTLEPWSNGSFPEKTGHSKYFLMLDAKLPDKVIETFLESMKRHFPEGKKSPRVYCFSGGEKNKTFSNLEKAYTHFIQAGIDRGTCLILLGGGVIGDFGGFVAASILRGVDFIQVPTTLLAAVDSSIGAKVGVNTKYGKNMIGAFHHPRLVYFHPNFLGTLSKREWVCGFAEMCKHAIIDESFESFNELMAFCKSGKNLFDPSSKALHQNIIKSMGVKARVVNQDEKESGLRAILNFGHTTGHAIESLSKKKRFAHGEAVSRGLVTALFLSEKKYNLDKDYVKEVLGMMQALSLPLDTASLPAKKLYEHMRYDKKNKDAKVLFVLLAEQGRAVWGQHVSFEDFSEAWSRQSALFD